MKKHLLFLLLLLISMLLWATEIRVTYSFEPPTIITHHQFYLVQFQGLMQHARIGEPMLPYRSVNILLPPGEEAFSLKIELLEEQEMEGSYILFPRQHSSPLSKGQSGQFVMNQEVYNSKEQIPFIANSRLQTGILNGHLIAMSSFTPVKYNPAEGKVIWYRKALVTVNTKLCDDSKSALKNLSDRETVKNIILNMVDNPEILHLYPYAAKKNILDLQIITPQSFKAAFDNLRSFYTTQSLSSAIISPDEINLISPGNDLQEKIRNYIIERYQQDDVRYILLGGDIELVPYRGFYCHVQSSSVYEDENIPSDLYYSSLDGTWNNNGNNRWGEPGEDDLLPDVAVARLPFSTLAEQANMLNKVYKYQSQPVANELTNSLLVGEHLWDNPLSWGGDYLDLLIGYHDDNGYITIGIPETSSIEKMYDRDLGTWSASQLRSKINNGKTLIHHSGHSNYTYAMRMSNVDITDANFSGVNGINHNYCIIYTHGCNCGGFNVNDCIAENMLKIQNFAVAGAFNSRYGWFNEGQTEGPSAHLHREFVHSLYTLGYNRIGETQQHSKIRTAPWVTAPGQWEEGALRWCFYSNNILGDPAMKIYTDNLTGIENTVIQWIDLQIFPNPASDLINYRIPDNAGEIEALNVLDVAGRILLSVNSGSSFGLKNQGQVNIQSLKPGIYLLAITTEQHRFFKQFVIVH
ncbi:MAG: C25 family cysteine peptidase [Bacteroidales bacterium]|nr:C25 family cysteine peptidase [Bacteroidales bacterium]MDZ4203321.1 C25 family cysteine peptidase [Bacteroidales bacterium]